MLQSMLWDAPTQLIVAKAIPYMDSAAQAVVRVPLAKPALIEIVDH